MNAVGPTDHVEVTIEDLFIEHYAPPPPKTSAAMKGRRRRGLTRRPSPPSSLLGLLGVTFVALGVYALKRWFA